MRIEDRVRELEEGITRLEQLVDALELELRAHQHNSFSGEYTVYYPARTEIAKARGTDGSEIPLR